LAFHELIRQKVAAQYVIEEIVIVIKDIFRQYPNRYESIIKDLCAHLRQLDNKAARAAMVWIVGEYGHRIDNAVDLMLHFSENFNDESKDVQMAILTASVKLYLRLEDDAEDLVTKVLKLATDDSDNPDLRNRGYIYWRMLSSDPEAAKQIILCEKPPITEDEGNLDSKVRETLLCNLSMLSSVYYKTPEQFVKRIRERLNERMDLDNEGEVA
jgi:AP-1 complex subunit beta-1